MTYDVNKTLGNYRLLQLLGQGGFADVYLGEHIYLKTSAAIKVMRVLLSSDALPPFLAEARTIANLRHPHIVLVHDFGIEHEVPFLVMGYAPYGSLRRLHPMGSCVPLATVALYVRQMADALQYAHDRKVIHRDVKPENILLGDHQVLMLSDFGIAVTLNSMPSNPVAREKDAVGTTTYMAPELFTGDAVFASDQYSLAIAVYEWLAGWVPFNGSDMEVALQHVYIALPSLRDKVPGLPDAVEQVVRKALAKKPEDRFSSITGFANAFEQACKDPPTYIEAEISAVPPTLPPLADTLEIDIDTPTGPGLQKLDQTTWHAPEMMRFDRPAWMNSQPSLPAVDVPSQLLSVTDKKKVVQVPVSLKLPAQTQRGSKRFFDYASVPNIVVVENPSSLLKPSHSASKPMALSPQISSWQKLQALLVVSTLKQKWTSQVVPGVKHLWQDQTVSKVKHFWVDRAVPGMKHLWVEHAVPSIRKISLIKHPVSHQQKAAPLDISVAQPWPPAPPVLQRSPTPPVALRSSTPPVQPRMTLRSTQSMQAAPPIIGDQKVSRRILIGGITALISAGVVGSVAATIVTRGINFSGQAVPASSPIIVQPTQTSKMTSILASQNPILLAPTRPSVTSSSIGQMDLFIRGSDGALWQRHFANQWGDWGMDIGGLTFDPVVTSWGPGRFDAFVRGADNTLQHSWYDGQWHPWESLGGALTSDPAAVAWGLNRLDVFVRSTDNALWHKWYDGSWHHWESLGGIQLSSPSASAWGANRLDVFIRGSDSALWHKWYDGNWHDWESLGGSFDSDPGSVSVAVNHLDVFVRGAGNALQRKSYDGTWHPWELLGGPLTSSPCAVTWQSGRIDVFARTVDNVLQQTWNEDGIWSAWLPLM